jgi:hypothetical protein
VLSRQNQRLVTEMNAKEFVVVKEVVVEEAVAVDVTEVAVDVMEVVVEEEDVMDAAGDAAVVLLLVVVEEGASPLDSMSRMRPPSLRCRRFEAVRSLLPWTGWIGKFLLRVCGRGSS